MAFLETGEIIKIDFSALLLEEIVFLGIRQNELIGTDLALCDEYQNARSCLYDLHQSKQDKAFYELNKDFILRLGYIKCIVETCREFSLLQGKVGQISFFIANKISDVGADLFLCQGKTDKCGNTVVFKVLVNQFLDIKLLKMIFRREFQHVNDMLDAEFGYDQSLDSENETMMRRKLIQDRYRVLWGAYVDFRLSKRFSEYKKGNMIDSMGRVFPQLPQSERLAILSRLENNKWTHGSLLKVAKMASVLIKT